MKIEQISQNVVKIASDSNCYIVEGSVVIDTSARQFSKLIAQAMESITSLNSIAKVIFTHLHYDHIGNFDLFKNAEFFCCDKGIRLMRSKKKDLAILNEDMAAIFNADLHDIAKDKQLVGMFEIIPTPGHSSTSICLYYSRDNVLFTGDTLFFRGYGRTDLPFSEPVALRKSLMVLDKLIQANKPIIAPGHDY